MSNTTLKGIKVVELGTHVAIPYFTRVLGDWGAEVIKIEPPKGESYRTVGMLFRLPYEEDCNVPFIPYNINKKSLSLNLKKKESVEVLLKLLEGADIFATNTRPAALEKMGLGLDTLKERFPHLIITHLNGFGEKGAEKDRPGFDAAAYWCRSGVLREWTNEEDRPFKPFYGSGDAVTSTQLLAGTMAALYNRDRTGKGDLIKVSLFSSGLWSNVMGIMRGQEQFGQTLPLSRTTPLLPLDNFYETKDGKWILISEEFWDKKCGAYFDILGKPEMKDNSDYNSLFGAIVNTSELVEIFEKGFAQIDSKDLVEMLLRIDTVYEFIAHPSEVSKDQQAWDNDFLKEIEAQDGTKFVIPTNPIVFESQGAADCVMAPRLGENSTDILKELGYSDGDIAAMIEENCVFTGTGGLA